MRPRDADESTTGTDDAVIVESGDERIILATNNAKAWESLISALGRDLDKGEVALTAEDGTNRGLIQLRPNGDIGITVGDGGSNAVIMSLDASAGTLTVTTTGDIDLFPTGLVHIGSGTSYTLVRWEQVQAWWDTLVTGVADLYKLHTHPDPVSGNTGPPSNTFPAYPTNAKSNDGRCN